MTEPASVPLPSANPAVLPPGGELAGGLPTAVTGEDGGREHSEPRPAAASRQETLLLALLFGGLYFVQGIAEPTEGLIAQPVKSLLDSWGLSVGAISLFAFWIALPWWLKPLFGLLSDFLPIFGSHRRNYLVLCNLLAIGGLLALYFIPWRPGSTVLLCLVLLAPTLAVAFSDVVIDGAMIDKGQPRGIVGKLQGAQWAGIYLATILAGSLGGWVSQQRRQEWGFLICAAVTLPALYVSLFHLADEPRRGAPLSARQAWADLRSAASIPALWAVAAFLFLWNFNPFSSTVLQLYMTGPLGLSEQFYGHTVSLSAAAAVTACLAYPFYCRLVPRGWLVHSSIVLGVLSTLGYLWLSGTASAVAITLAVGLTYMTALLIQLDLAAQACPARAAATVFAALMAVSNFGISLSTAAGGLVFDLASARWGSHAAFNLLVLLGAGCTSMCWILYPFLRERRESPE